MKVFYCVGGVLSPLLANIALSVIEERYERWVYKMPTPRRAIPDPRAAARQARSYDRGRGRSVCFPIRYADDVIVLVSGTRDQALAEKNALAEHLRSSLGLELSAEKTRITPFEEGFDFLGHRVRLKWNRFRGAYASLEIPKAKTQEFCLRIKRLTGRSTCRQELCSLLRRLNPIIRGWANYHRHCYGAKEVFSYIDWYIHGRIRRWLRKKYPQTGFRKLLARFYGQSTIGHRRVWRHDGIEIFRAASLTVERFRHAWMRLPDFAMTSGEPDA